MLLIELSLEEYLNLLNSNEKCIIKYYINNCKPCKRLDDILKKTELNNHIYCINYEKYYDYFENNLLLTRYPTIIFFTEFENYRIEYTNNESEIIYHINNF